MSNGKSNTKSLVVGALLTAVVFLLQFSGASIRFGTFSISLVLIPIVIGAVTCKKWIGAWLGLVFGFAVLASGDANLFLGFNVIGTIITVLLKGAACGFVSGAVYELALKLTKKTFLSTVLSALVCPIVNTGVFLLGCKVFLMDAVSYLAGGAADLGRFMIFVLVGVNFLVEMAVIIIFVPMIVYIIKAVTKNREA